MNPSATRVLETERMYSEAREALSLAVCERAPWSVKCSVVSAVRSSWRSGTPGPLELLGLEVVRSETVELDMECGATPRDHLALTAADRRPAVDDPDSRPGGEGSHSDGRGRGRHANAAVVWVCWRWRS